MCGGSEFCFFFFPILYLAESFVLGLGRILEWLSCRGEFSQMLTASFAFIFTPGYRNDLCLGGLPTDLGTCCTIIMLPGCE